MLKNFYQV